MVTAARLQACIAVCTRSGAHTLIQVHMLCCARVLMHTLRPSAQRSPRGTGADSARGHRPERLRYPATGTPALTGTFRVLRGSKALALPSSPGADWPGRASWGRQGDLAQLRLLPELPSVRMSDPQVSPQVPPCVAEEPAQPKDEKAGQHCRLFPASAEEGRQKVDPLPCAVETGSSSPGGQSWTGPALRLGSLCPCRGS